MLVEVSPNGELTFLYDDNLRGLMDSGQAKVTRASDVEPDENGQWTADLKRVGGPVLGPFRLREEALTAEKEWLEANHFGKDYAKAYTESKGGDNA
jgi:hypothetical protein